MIQITNKWLVLGVLVPLLSATFTGCVVTTPEPAAATAPIMSDTAVSAGYEDIPEEVSINMTDAPAPVSVALSQLSVGTLNDADTEGLLYMREEEKLARDVYLALYEIWGMRIFQNIANSEQTHMNAVKTLLDRYDLEDPAADKDLGVFTNPTLQALYDQLMEEGNQSLADALRVGATIEEIDILDLEERIGQTDEGDIRLVYENLMKGSRNHLRAFISVLNRQTGATYQPQYLSQSDYDAIVNAPGERGRGRRS